MIFIGEHRSKHTAHVKNERGEKKQAVWWRKHWDHDGLRFTLDYYLIYGNHDAVLNVLFDHVLITTYYGTQAKNAWKLAKSDPEALLVAVQL